MLSHDNLIWIYDIIWSLHTYLEKHNSITNTHTHIYNALIQRQYPCLFAHKLTHKHRTLAGKKRQLFFPLLLATISQLLVSFLTSVFILIFKDLFYTAFRVFLLADSARVWSRLNVAWHRISKHSKMLTINTTGWLSRLTGKREGKNAARRYCCCYHCCRVCCCCCYAQLNGHRRRNKMHCKNHYLYWVETIWLNGWLVGLRYRLADARTSARTNERTNGWLDGRRSGWAVSGFQWDAGKHTQFEWR